MNAIPKKPEIPAAVPTSVEMLDKAYDSFINLRDAVYAIRLIVGQPWDSGYSADTARNALDWISKKMDEECDVQDEAFDALMAGRVQQ